MEYELGLYIVLETSSSTRAELFSIQNGASFDRRYDNEFVFRQLRIRITRQGLALLPRRKTANNIIPD